MKKSVAVLLFWAVGVAPERLLAAEKVELPKVIGLAYSTGQTLEPFYFALTHGLIRSIERPISQGAASPSAVAASTATDGSVLLVAFVRYIGDEGVRAQLKRLVPVAFLGEGFTLFGPDGQSALGWWGVFAPPGTSQELVTHYETVFGSQKLQKYLAGTVKKLGGYYKVDLLPAPELTRPATAATLIAMLTAPPRVPTPAGVAAAKARATQLKKGPDAATARRDDPNGFLMIRAVGGPRYTGGVGGAMMLGLRGSLPSALAGVELGSAAALNLAMAPMIQAMQSTPVPGNTGITYLQQFQSALAGNRDIASALLQTLEASAPQAPEGSLVSLFQEIRGMEASPFVVPDRIAMAIAEVTGADSSTSEQLRQMLLKVVGQRTAVTSAAIAGTTTAGAGSLAPVPAPRGETPTFRLTQTDPCIQRTETRHAPQVLTVLFKNVCDHDIDAIIVETEDDGRLKKWGPVFLSPTAGRGKTHGLGDISQGDFVGQARLVAVCHEGHASATEDARRRPFVAGAVKCEPYREPAHAWR